MRVSLPHTFPIDIRVTSDMIEITTASISATTGFPGSFSFTSKRRSGWSVADDVLDVLVRAFQHEVIETLEIDGERAFPDPHSESFTIGEPRG